MVEDVSVIFQGLDSTYSLYYSVYGVGGQGVTPYCLPLVDQRTGDKTVDIANIKMSFAQTHNYIQL